MSMYGTPAGTVTTRGNGTWVLICPQEDNLTPSMLTSYVNRTNTILEELIQTYDNDKAFNRLDIIRQEICTYTNTPFRPLVQKITISNGKK